MLYLEHLNSFNDLIKNLTDHTMSLSDPLLRSKYTGFLTISSVTLYELAIKSIILSFTKKRDHVFNNYAEQAFKRLNAKIKLQNLRDDYLKRFGGQYLTKFNSILISKEKEHLLLDKQSITNSYSNIIQWRHDFTHEGKPPLYASFTEVINSFEVGKHVIHSFSQALSDQ
jgi:hypothetical protein